MARRLKTVAAWINANLSAHGYAAETRESFCNTDRQAGRLRIPGKGRAGTRLIVTRNGQKVLDHNSAETYRSNDEVERWLSRLLRDLAE